MEAVAQRGLSQAGAQQVAGWVRAGRGHGNEGQTTHSLGFYSKGEGMTGGFQVGNSSFLLFKGGGQRPLPSRARPGPQLPTVTSPC